MGDAPPPPRRTRRATRGVAGSNDAPRAEKSDANEPAPTPTPTAGAASSKPRRAKRAPREHANEPTHARRGNARDEKAPRAPRRPREPRAREKGGHDDKENGSGEQRHAADEKEEEEEREEREEEEDEEVDWSTAAWFAGCDADLGAAYWLLSRCVATSDAVVLGAEALVRRALRLQQLGARFKAALLPRDDDESDAPREWPAREILREAQDAFPDQEHEGHENHAGRSAVLAQLEGEVVEAATELLTSRVARDELALLVQWEAFLASLLPEPKQPKPSRKKKAKDETTHEQPEQQEQQEQEEEEEKKNETPLAPERRRRGGSTNHAIAHAKATVSAAVAFHRAYEHRQGAEREPSEELSAATTQWTREIDEVVEATRVSPAEEARRKGVAAQIESAFRRSSQWRQCEVLLFGSSLSKFGSQSSDLDLCLRANPTQSEIDTAAKMSVRELRLRMRRLQREQDGELPTADGSSRNDDAQFLDETLVKTSRTIEALGNVAAKQRKKTKSKDVAKLKRLVLLRAHWKALAVALAFFRDKAGTNVSAKREASAAAAEYHKALHKQQKERQKDIYAAAALLGRNGCHIELVLPNARVPVIGFTHSSSGLDCDLCFENYHACVNTLLLRAYAELDERARALGLAVKHWAKRRGLNDASTGHLSSYSFILLVLFFLQHKARVLPNLQHPELLQEAGVTPVMLNGVDVSFCSDLDRARAFHAKTATAPSTSETVGELLLGFFRFYANEFDFSDRVVSVRHPETPMHKQERWTRGKLKAWRVSIEDPLEFDRDLGSVLQLRCQQRILEELQRARTLLEQGKSFATVLCEASANVSAKPPKKKAERQEKKAEKQEKKTDAQERNAEEGKTEKKVDRQERKVDREDKKVEKRERKERTSEKHERKVEKEEATAEAKGEAHGKNVNDDKDGAPKLTRKKKHGEKKAKEREEKLKANDAEDNGEKTEKPADSREEKPKPRDRPPREKKPEAKRERAPRKDKESRWRPRGESSKPAEDASVAPKTAESA